MRSRSVLREQRWRRAALGAASIAVVASVVVLAVAPGSASPDLRSYANTLVHRVGDPTKASWYVTSDLKRLYVPDAATYTCFRKRGAFDRGPVRVDVLLKLQDQIRLRASCGDRMTADYTELRKGMFLKSSDGRFKLILQGDGNLVLYGPSGAIWSNQQFDSVAAIFQGEGNFVTHRADDTPNWSTGTRLEGGQRLVVQSDGNLVMYSSTKAVWASGTSASGGRWRNDQLTIRANALGAVRVGMTLAEAEGAAGVKFDGRGDGAYYPTTLPARFAHLFVDSFDGTTVGCVGAESGSPAKYRESITTREGFHLGGTVAALKAIYGKRLRHVAEPPSGIDPRDGYVVAEASGSLAFSVGTDGVVWGISGGRRGFDGKPLVPSTCIG